MAINRPTTDPWPSLIAQWKLSGLTQAEFCRRRGLSLPTFRYHLYRLVPDSYIASWEREDSEFGGVPGGRTPRRK
jgi:hypothetical protein